MTPSVQVIGFGPAGLGLPLAADRLGRLDELGAAGLVFLDRARHAEALRVSRFPYLIDSNSPAGDFTAAVDPDGRFGPVLRRPAAAELRARAAEPVPLRLVGAYLGDMADNITTWLRTGAGEVRYGRAVATVRRHGTTFTSYDAEGRPITDSRSVVLATGAREAVEVPGVPPERVVASAAVLAGRRRAEPGGHAVIVGGSHSGFAVADVLLRKHGVAGVTVVHRGLSLGFASLADLAGMDAALFAPSAVCRETGRVNRFTGLRSRARELCLAVLAGSEPRVRLCADGTPEAALALAEATLVVSASGYRSAVPALYDDEHPVPVTRLGGAALVDDQCRVLGPDGPIAGVHGLGIGFARLHHTGERRVGVNVFHGPDAGDILANLLHPAAAPAGT
ncbi:FAD/NAD(P)-binding protein [Actinokineospora sp. 24-640]